MKARVDRNRLLSCLQMAQNIVERKTTLPLLSHILLESTPSGLRLSSTDLEVGVTDTCPAQSLEEGRTTVHGKKFFEIIRELPETVIELEQRNENLVIKTGRSLFRLRSLSPDEFPKIPVVQSVNSVSLKGEHVHEMIERVSISVSSDETRYTLTGVLVEFEKEEGKCVMRMISTDGHRLSCCERDLQDAGSIQPFFGSADGEIGDIILPKKAVQEMKRITEAGGDLEFGVFQENAFVKKEDFSMVMRLVQGKFPDFRAVIPKEISKRLTINASTVEQALRRVSLLSTDKAKAARFLVESGRMVISTTSPEMGEAEEEVDVEYGEEPFEVSFNVRYLLEYLQIVDGKIDLEFGEQMRPCVIKNRKDDRHFYILMPLRE